MTCKYTESELSDQMENVLEVCNKNVYTSAYLTCINMILGLDIKYEDVEWDIFNEREKFEEEL